MSLTSNTLKKYGLMFALIIMNYQYSTYDLFEVTAFNSHERAMLYNMQTKNESVIFLNGVTNEAILPMQVIVDKCCIEEVQEALERNGMVFNHVIIESSNDSMRQIEFLPWEDVVKWVDNEQRKNPILKKTNLSFTYEKREIFTVSIIKNKKNPSVVIIGGEQGKDWMSTSLIISLIEQILERDLKVLLNHYNFYFFPILNPDGYIFSMEKDRFWAKNRKVIIPHKPCKQLGAHVSDNIAVGVNIERNWYFENSQAREDKCGSIYSGQEPLSEEETKALAAFLNSHAINLMAFINVIGFGNRLVTIPYSQLSLDSNNHGVLMEIIAAACDEVYKKHNASYFYGPTGRFYCNSADWVKQKLNIPLVYTVYMKYKNEFTPKPEHVAPLSQELAIILRESLMISKEIYGTLFNNNKNIQYNESLLIFIFMNVVYCHLYNFMQL